MKKLLYLIIGIILLGSCSDFDELNTDPKSPTSIPAEPLFTDATRNLFDRMQSINVNSNVFRLYAQYWAQCTYPDESQYNMTTISIPDGIFRTLYRDVLKDYDESKKLLLSQDVTNAQANIVRQNKLSIIGIMEVYTYHVLVDVFGDVPYSEALNPDNVLPKYDNDTDIYLSLIDKLNNEINMLNVSSSAFSASEDPVYGGDVKEWKKFANSLKLRLALRIADIDNAKAKQLAESAVASGVFTSNADNCSMTYYATTPNTNPIWVDLIQSGRKDFVPANTLVDYMNSKQDPRRHLWFSLASSGNYTGGIYGNANAYSAYSHFHDGDASTVTFPLEMPDLKGAILNFAEVEFNLAEAVERGYSVGGTAKGHYEAGIKASILEWGGTEADYNAYLPGVDYSLSTDWKQKIGVQHWLSQFNQGFDGWSIWRRLDFTMLTPPSGMNYSDIPVRMIYPISEATLNGPSLTAAAAAIGGDLPSTKVFWDVN